MITKICSKCKKEKELNKDSFYNRKISLDGFCGICKDCKTINKDRKYIHIKNGLLLCLKCNKYQNKNNFDINKDKIYRRCRDSRCKTCKKEQNIKRKFNNRGKQDLDRILLERWHGLKDRYKKLGFSVDFKSDYLKELWVEQKGLCNISKIPMTYIMNKGRTYTNISVDRINSNIGYIKGNIQLVCMAVNQMKSDLKIDELVYICKEIINNYESKNN